MGSALSETWSMKPILLAVAVAMKGVYKGTLNAKYDNNRCIFTYI